MRFMMRWYPIRNVDAFWTTHRGPRRRLAHCLHVWRAIRLRISSLREDTKGGSDGATEDQRERERREREREEREREWPSAPTKRAAAGLRIFLVFEQ